jgi:hypothetical protein
MITYVYCLTTGLIFLCKLCSYQHVYLRCVCVLKLCLSVFVNYQVLNFKARQYFFHFHSQLSVQFALGYIFDWLETVR